MQKTFINAIILIVVFITGAITGAGGLYFYSKDGLERVRGQYNEIAEYNRKLQDTNRQTEYYNNKLEKQLARREEYFARREEYITELEEIVRSSKKLDRDAGSVFESIESILDKYRD